MSLIEGVFTFIALMSTLGHAYVVVHKRKYSTCQIRNNAITVLKQFFIILYFFFEFCFQTLLLEPHLMEMGKFLFTVALHLALIPNPLRQTFSLSNTHMHARTHTHTHTHTHTQTDRQTDTHRDTHTRDRQRQIQTGRLLSKSLGHIRCFTKKLHKNVYHKIVIYKFCFSVSVGNVR